MEQYEYYYIKSLRMAMGIEWLIHEHFYVVTDKYDETQKRYCFKNTEKFRQAMNSLLEVRKSLE